MPDSARKHALHEHVEQRLRGAKPTDISSRARAVIWYQLVHNRTDLPDNELDEMYVEPDRKPNEEIESKTRVFWKVRRFGTDPHWHITEEALKRRAARLLADSSRQNNKVEGNQNRKPRKPQRQFSVVDRLAEKDKKFLPCKEFYHSSLWEILGPRRPTVAIIEEIIDKRMTNDQLFRAVHSSPVPWTRGDLVKGEIPWASDGMSHREQVALLLTDDPTANDIAFFGALYLQAYNEASLDIAVALRDAVRWITTQFIKKNDINGFPKFLLETLIEERLLRSRWEDLVTKKELKRAEEYLDASGLTEGKRYGHAPLKVIGYALLDSRERKFIHNIPVSGKAEPTRRKLIPQQPLYTEPSKAISALNSYFAPDPSNLVPKKGTKATSKKQGEITNIDDTH